jgi:signal transduction histidine kinase
MKLRLRDWLSFTIAAVLILGGAAAFHAHQSQRRENGGDLRRMVAFVAAMGIDYLNLLHSLERVAEGGLEAHLELAQMRFDLFWVRMRILAEAREAQPLLKIAEYERSLRQLEATMARAERALDGVTPPDRSRLKEPFELASSVSSLPKDLFFTANASAGLMHEFYEAVAARSLLILQASMAVVVAVALVLVGLQLWDGRVRARLLATADSALARLRDQQAALQRALTAAEDASRTKTYFMAHMSHELRTPLNAILGFSDIMRREMFGKLGSPRYAEYAADIHRSAAHLLEIISSLLSLSQIDAGKLVIQESEVDAVAVCKFAIDLLREASAAKQLRVDLVPAPDLPSVHADERALKQIVTNLLSNAVKFTPHGGSITVRVCRSPQDGMTIVVEDIGIGMAPAKIERAFEPYSQVSDPWNRQSEGVGLGLALVRSLVELHDGAVHIASAPGAGTIVRVDLPPARVLKRPATFAP